MRPTDSKVSPRKKRNRTLAGILLFALAAAPATSAERQKIGLVLEGGGALGFAHIGVIQWLEANRIPVDAIAGTSMGGLVGGLYAAGKSPAEIKSLVDSVDWQALLRSQEPFKDLSLRRKEDRIAFPNLLEFGLRDGISLPAGLNSGQEIDYILDRSLLPYYNVPSFDDLPIPFRCVSIDLVSGKEVHFDKGSLANAIRATISIPAIFAPEKIDGALYADGGVLNNLPVDVARKMNVDLVIAVYLDTGPPDLKALSLVGVASRTTSIVIAANEMRNIEDADILLSADVSKFSGANFEKSADIIPQGFKAAEHKRAILSRLALPEDAWQAYLAERSSRQLTVAAVPEFVAVAGTSEFNQRVIQNALAKQIGQPLNTARLERALDNVNIQGSFSSLRYKLLQRDGKTGIAINVTEKTNGPPFINFGLNLDGADPNDVRFGLSARLTMLNLGGFRSEWRTDISLFNRYQISSEYFHPFNESTKWFIAPRAFAGKSRFDLYNNRNRTSEYSVHRIGVGLDLGYSLSRHSEIRLGEDLINRQADLKLGAAFTPNYSRTTGDSSLRFEYLGQDDTVIPHRGLNVHARFDWLTYPSAQSNVSGFVPVSERGSVLLTASASSAFGTKNLGLEAFTLGGPFRLGAYGINELIGNQYFLFQGGYSHRIFNFNPLAGGAVYGLAFFEIGKMYGSPIPSSRLPADGSLVLVTKTALGPIFIGSSLAAADRLKWWFGVGHVF